MFFDRYWPLFIAYSRSDARALPSPRSCVRFRYSHLSPRNHRQHAPLSATGQSPNTGPIDTALGLAGYDPETMCPVEQLSLIPQIASSGRLSFRRWRNSFNIESDIRFLPRTVLRLPRQRTDNHRLQASDP